MPGLRSFLRNSCCRRGRFFINIHFMNSFSPKLRKLLEFDFSLMISTSQCKDYIILIVYTLLLVVLFDYEVLLEQLSISWFNFLIIILKHYLCSKYFNNVIDVILTLYSFVTALKRAKESVTLRTLSVTAWYWPLWKYEVKGSNTASNMNFNREGKIYKLI